MRPTTNERCSTSRPASWSDVLPAARRPRRRVDATPAFAASYRRQAAELGWFSMLVPESLGGGSISGNGVLDAALIAYQRGGRLQPGSFVGTNVVADAARRGRQRRRSAGDGPAGAAVAATPRRRGRSPPRRRPARTAASTAAPLGDGGLELTGVKTAVQDVERVVVAARHVRTRRTVPPRRSWPPTPPGSPSTELESLDLSRRFAEVRFDGARVAVVRRRRRARRGRRAARPAAGHRRHAHRRRDGRGDGPRLRDDGAVRQGPHRLRPADRLVPGRQAPARRHQPGARDEQGGRAGRGPHASARTTTTAPRRPAWPRRSSATPASSWPRTASRSSAASGTRGSTTSTCTCAASPPTPGSSATPPGTASTSASWPGL